MTEYDHKTLLRLLTQAHAELVAAGAPKARQTDIIAAIVTITDITPDKR